MKTKTLSLYLGLILSALGMLNFGLWIYAATRDGKTFDESKRLYLDVFPSFLQNPVLLGVLTILCFGLSLFLLIRVDESLNRLSNRLRTSTIVIDSFLLAWNVFALM